MNSIKALQKYFKTSQQHESQSKKKQLLADDDPFVHVSFTLTQVPTRPTPRPLRVEIPKPFNSKKFDTRICIFVKDPESEFKR